MFCDHCHCELHAAVDGRCPDCGQPFNPDDPGTYRAHRFTPSARERRILKSEIAIVGLTFLLALIVAVTVFQIAGWFE